MLNPLDLGVFYGVREILYANPLGRRFTLVRLHSEAKLRTFTTRARQEFCMRNWCDLIGLYQPLTMEQ